MVNDARRDADTRNPGGRNPGDRYDRNDDNRRDGRWDRRDDRRDGRYDNRNGGRNGGWNQDWRRDQRYNWQSHRSRYRHIYRQPTYYSPYRNWNYRRLSIGFSLWPLFYSDRYWINDPWQYRLPDVYGPYRWVRYYDDALLIDLQTGQVVDVIYDVWW